MKNRGAIRFSFLALSVFLFAACLAGGGTDVGNPDVSARVTGSIKQLDGSPAPRVRMHLRPKAFLPLPDSVPKDNGHTIQDGSSDTQGFFTFDSVPKGDYRIEAMDTAGHGAEASFTADGRTERLTVAPLFVDTTGWITGNVNYLGPALSNSKIIISVYGTDRWTETITGGDFFLSALPAGTYTLRISTIENPALFTLVPDVRLTAGAKASVGTVNLGP